jgi:hypothetical protein
VWDINFIYADCGQRYIPQRFAVIFLLENYKIEGGKAL